MAEDKIITKRCPKCGCEVYINERIVCSDDGSVVRRFVVRGENDKKLDQIYLRCDCKDVNGNICGAELVVEVDCEDYR